MAQLLGGLLTGWSLIIAIGAQNAFVLRQGIRREHAGAVVAICALSDLALIVAGVLGMGALITAHPVALTVFKWAGAIYLGCFAASSARSALRPKALAVDPDRRSARSVLVTTLALTWLNPHVYLDTVIMLGNIANQYGPQRWWFASGAGLASITWFLGLGFGAHGLAGPLARPRVWQVIDLVIAAIMVAIAIRLVTL